MSFLTKDTLSKLAERRYLQFDIDIDGESVTCRVQSLTEKERSNYEAASMIAKGKKAIDRTRDMKRRLIVLCLVDQDNKPMYSLSEAHKLEEIDSRITSIIFTKCVDHIGIEEEDLDDLVGNSSDIDAD